MLLNLLTKPISTSKKLIQTLTQNSLIILSIGIPLLIAFLPSFIIKQKLNAAMKPLINVSGLIGGITKNDNLLKLLGNLESTIFKLTFQKLLICILLVIAITFIVLFVYYRIKKIEINPQYVWKAITVSGIQVAYYTVLSMLLSYISIKLIFIFIIGLFNSIICLYSLLPESDVDVSTTQTDVQADYSTGEIPLTVAFDEAAATIATVPAQMPTTNKIQDEFIDPLTNLQNITSKPSVPITTRIKSLNSSQKKIILACTVTAVVVLGGYNVGKSLTSKETISKNLSKAINENNGTAMAKYIVSSDSRLKIDEESLSAYINYLKENPSYTSKLLNSIDSQAKTSDKKSSTLSSPASENNLIKLTTQGKKLLIFDRYVYQLPAYLIRVQTTYKNTEISINDKSTFVSDSNNLRKECGPYLPGKYKLTAKLKSDYAEVNGESTAVLAPDLMSSNIVDISVPLNGKQLNVYSDYKDAKIIVNGKNTGITIENASNLIPLPQDGTFKIQLQNEFPWGILTSNEQAFAKTSFNFTFDKDNSNLLDSIKPAIGEFLKSYVDAYTSMDSEKLKSVTDDLKDSLQRDIEWKKNYPKPFAGSITSAIADTSTLDLHYSSYNKTQSYSVSVDVSINSNFTYGENPFMSAKRYSIKLNYDTTEKKWFVNSLYNSYGSEIKTGTEIKLQ